MPHSTSPAPRAPAALQTPSKSHAVHAFPRTAHGPYPATRSATAGGGSLAADRFLSTAAAIPFGAQTHHMACHLTPSPPQPFLLPLHPARTPGSDFSDVSHTPPAPLSLLTPLFAFLASLRSSRLCAIPPLNTPLPSYAFCYLHCRQARIPKTLEFAATGIHAPKCGHHSSETRSVRLVHLKLTQARPVLRSTPITTQQTPAAAGHRRYSVAPSNSRPSMRSTPTRPQLPPASPPAEAPIHSRALFAGRSGPSGVCSTWNISRRSGTLHAASSRLRSRSRVPRETFGCARST